jgi:hypothetical protein
VETAGRRAAALTNKGSLGLLAELSPGLSVSGRFRVSFGEFRTRITEKLADSLSVRPDRMAAPYQRTRDGWGVGLQSR